MEKVGQQLQIIIDEVNNNGIVGRSYADAPDIDGNVFINSTRSHEVGEIVTVKIDKSDNYDLWGSVVDNRSGDI